MAQADLNVANQSGAGFRADLNNQLLALGTLQSGSSAPSTTMAYMLWADTSTSPATLRQRNGTNNAWIALGLLDTTNLGHLALTGGTLTGALLASSTGNAAAPALSVAGDTDTGIFGKAANQLGISTAGAERGYFDASGWNGPVVGAVTTTSVNGGPLAGFRNLLINGNPIINQRGYLGANTTVANEYTLDRWRVVTSGQAITWSTNSNVRTVNAPAGGIEQVIEGESILGGTYTLSWTGTATATVNGVTVANGGTVALAGGLNATVRFINGTFSLAQLEPGTVATPFERRPVGQELALCQRYYEIQPFETYLGFPAPNATFAHIFPLFFMVPKRAIPTISYSINNMFNLASSSIVFVTPQSWSLQLVAAGNTNTVASTNFTASAEL